jgi:hypothetical protein
MAVLWRPVNALKKGDANFPLPTDWEGTAGKVADVYRDIQDLHLRVTEEFGSLRRKVGKEGKLRYRGKHRRPARLLEAQGREPSTR